MIIDRKLEIFKMAAILHNFTAAAAALGMSQPNVTHQIAQLETELGVPLFERGGRHLNLTKAGRVLLAESERLSADADTLMRKVRNAGESGRRLRIGATQTAGGYIIPELLTTYMRRNGDTLFDLHVGNTAEIADMVKKRQLDFGLVEGAFDRGFFFYRHLVDDELFPVGAHGALSENISLAEYIRGGGKFILREAGSGTRYCFDLFIKEHALPVPDAADVVVVNSFDAIKNMVADGYGITVISGLVVAAEIAAGRLSSARFREGMVTREINFIYLPDENLKFIERFIAFCRDKVADRSPSR